MKLKTFAGITVVLAALTAGTANAQMRITEWMYNGATEFMEFTNVGASSIDMTGWSYDDSDRVPGSVDLTAFGSVAAGESVILTEVADADFRTAWSLDAAVKVIGGNDNNLGRNDEINLYNAADELVDRLTYGDQDYVGSIRTNAISGNPATPAALGANDVYQWVLSAPGDAFGSYTSVAVGDLAGGDVANPGVYIAGAVPEPGTVLLLILGAAGLLTCRRR